MLAKALKILGILAEGSPNMPIFSTYGEPVSPKLSGDITVPAVLGREIIFASYLRIKSVLVDVQEENAELRAQVEGLKMMLERAGRALEEQDRVIGVLVRPAGIRTSSLS